jgi:hypothetical protein
VVPAWAIRLKREMASAGPSRTEDDAGRRGVCDDSDELG